MGWIIGIVLLVVVAGALWGVWAVRAKARHDILQRLRPGVRFRARDESGATYFGECVRVLDDETIEAVLSRGSGREKKKVPIRQIFTLGS